MALNIDKISRTLESKLSKIPERTPGYHEQVISTIKEIIREERQHQIQSTSIQSKVEEICNELGKYITEHED